MPSLRNPTEAALVALHSARQESAVQATALIRQGLASGYPAVVAKAATLAGSLELRSLEPALVACYEALAEDPDTRDPLCAAMKEIVATLFQFESPSASVYLHAAGHVQHAGWDRQDVGAPLRGIAVQALVKIEHPLAISLAADMLVDTEAWARIGAAKALRATGSEASALLLRLKALTGDTSAEVYAECFAAMLEYTAAWLDVVAGFLQNENDAVVALAALAIGDARPAGALPSLTEAWETQTNPDAREAILNAIASLRSDEAVEFLIGLVGGDSMTAMQAMSALTLYAASESVVSQVRAAAKANRRKEVASMFERLFG